QIKRADALLEEFDHLLFDALVEAGKWKKDAMGHKQSFTRRNTDTSTCDSMQGSGRKVLVEGRYLAQLVVREGRAVQACYSDYSRQRQKEGGSHEASSDKRCSWCFGYGGLGRDDNAQRIRSAGQEFRYYLDRYRRRRGHLDGDAGRRLIPDRHRL